MALDSKTGETRPPVLAAWQGETGLALSDRAEEFALPCLALPLAHAQQASQLAHIIAELEGAAAALFPAWLPEAEGVETPGGAGLQAVAALARSVASRTDLFGPYLAAISKAALRKTPETIAGKFPAETSLRECFKLFCRAYGTKSAVLILTLPDQASDTLVAQVQQAAIFIAAQDAFLVWIAGAGMERLDRIALIATPQGRTREKPGGQPDLARPHITPLSGRPNPFSDTEKRLEAFLLRCAWARGRAWNASWSDGPLSNPILVDLLWQSERLVVELDGPDHVTPEKYARDRARDRALQAAGYAVLRFTNDEIAEDLARVASEIERFLTRVRAEQG